MTNYRILVDAERLLAEHLRADADLAALVGTRVYTEIPRTATFPLVVIRRFGGTTVHEGWLDRARIQVDAWAARLEEDSANGGKRRAHDVAATAMLALHRSRLESHSLGVVTDVVDEIGLTWDPDPETDRPRYRFDVAVTLHPLVDGS